MIRLGMTQQPLHHLDLTGLSQHFGGQDATA